MSSVTAVIPTWNRADLLRQVLHCLKAQRPPLEEIVVVDNGSSDGSESVAREAGTRVIRFEENRGFAVAVNEGVRAASSKWVLILNNDVMFGAEWLDRLVMAAESDGADFAAGKLLRPGPERLMDGSWDLVSRGGYAWRCGYGRPAEGVWNEKRRVPFVPMTAALFQRRVFDEVGFLDTRFESYYEDVDFGIRCALAGLKGLYEPGAEAVHLEKSTFGKAGYRVMFLSARNQLILLAKHYPRETLFRFAWPILLGQTLSLFAAGRHKRFLAALRGKLAGLRLWSAFRNESGAAAEAEKVFTRCELDIRNLQRQIGFDIYWKLYFRLLAQI